MMKVLVADDDIVSRTILHKTMAKWGHEVVVACNGNEAWEAITRPGAPRLAVIDWMMPGLDGVEVCRRVKELEMDDPPYIILLTMRDNKDDIVEGLRAGASDYIVKPYDLSELKARVEVGGRVVDLQEKLHTALEYMGRQALTDPLTTAPNRRAILEALKAEKARAVREKTSLWISILDIDHFKQVNDRYGHLAGDAVIREVVRRIQAIIRPYDSVGRWGGDEFLIVVPMSVQMTTPPDVFERIRLSVEGTAVRLDGNEISVTVSQGVASLGSDDTMDDLIQRSDVALYRVKEKGRNRVEFSLGHECDADHGH